MIIPEAEKRNFEVILSGQAKNVGLGVPEYLRKVWYHEQAAKIGEYMALTLVDELLALIGEGDSQETELIG